MDRDSAILAMQRAVRYTILQWEAMSDIEKAIGQQEEDSGDLLSFIESQAVVWDNQDVSLNEAGQALDLYLSEFSPDGGGPIEEENEEENNEQ